MRAAERGHRTSVGLPGLVLGLAVGTLLWYRLIGWPPPVLPPLLQTVPSWATVDVWLRSPMATDWTGFVAAIGLVGWAFWVWVWASVLLELAVNLADAATQGAAWVAVARTALRPLTVPFIRRIVDASLGGLLVARVALQPVVVEAAASPWQAEVATVASSRADTAQAFTLRGASRLRGPSFQEARAFQEAAPDTAGQEGRHEVLYHVQPGDSLWAIAERFYGDGEQEARLFEANLGGTQADGRTLTRHAVIYPNWILRVPEPTDGVESDAGEWWYTVQAGDTLSGICARLLGDPDRSDEVFQLNRGAQVSNGRILLNPNLIWPGLRLQLPIDGPAISVGEPPADSSPAPVAAPPPVVPTPGPEPSQPAAATAAPEAPVATPAPEPEPEPEQAQVAPSPPVPPATETAAAASPGKPAVEQWPALPLSTDRIAELAIAAGLSAAVVAALRARRRPLEPLAAESDTQHDIDAFTLAEPAAVVAARRAGGDDPHGIVLGELLAGELLGRAQLAGLANVQVVSVAVGKTRCEALLAAALPDRTRLEAALRSGPSMARRMNITRSADQDIVVHLEGVQRAALARTPPRDSPVLLCIGLQPDSRACLAGWNAIGNLLVATPPATTDAQEHLAALVATLAGQCAPAELRLYTFADEDTLLGRLGQLPHQRALVEPRNSEPIGSVLAGLRAEVEMRQQSGKTGALPEVAVVVSELAHLAAYEDFVYVLTHGHRYGIRVLAATTDGTLVRGPLVDLFESRFVFGLEDEEASIRLLGKPWALTLAEPGRLLARIGRRKEIEILGLHLTEAGLQDLLAEVGVEETAASAAPVEIVQPPESQADAATREEPVTVSEVAGSVGETGSVGPVVAPDGVAMPREAGAPSTVSVEAATAPKVMEAEPTGPAVRAKRNGHVVNTPAMERVSLPERIELLLKCAPLVVDCEQGAVWSLRGQLSVEQSSLMELLPYLGAAALLEQGPLDRWMGVGTEELLEEVWAPRARDRTNRESGQTWLRKSLVRLQEEVSKAAGGLAGELLVNQNGGLRLNPRVVRSDVEAFIAAVERARTARGSDQIAAAEEALVLRVPDLLPHAPREQLVGGRWSKVYGWLDQPRWERAGARLPALGREAACVLARAYRDAGRCDAALAVYAQLLGEDPLDQQAAEGLLVAAAGMRDAPQLEEAWQQVLVCADGEVNSELRALYERLTRESAATARGSGHAAVA